MALKSNRRWLQFSLRSLILFTLVGGLVSGRLGRLIEEKYDSERAIEEQRKTWDESHQIAEVIRRQIGGMAMACTQLKAPDYVYVELNSRSATDEALSQLAKMPRIGSVHIYGSNVTDAGVRHLASLVGLQYLMIDCKKVTDAGLPYLAKMSRLRRLDLRSSSVTDDGVSKLQKSLPNCQIVRKSDQ